MIFDALVATIGDLAVGLLAAVILFATFAFMARQEEAELKREREAELRAVPDAQESDIWGGAWSEGYESRPAEARFGSGREAA